MLRNTKHQNFTEHNDMGSMNTIDLTLTIQLVTVLDWYKFHNVCTNENTISILKKYRPSIESDFLNYNCYKQNYLTNSIHGIVTYIE